MSDISPITIRLIAEGGPAVQEMFQSAGERALEMGQALDAAAENSQHLRDAIAAAGGDASAAYRQMAEDAKAAEESQHGMSEAASQAGEDLKSAAGEAASAVTEVGEKGAEAGDKVKQGSEQASAGLHDVKDSSDEAGKAVHELVEGFEAMGAAEVGIKGVEFSHEIADESNKVQDVGARLKTVLGTIGAPEDYEGIHKAGEELSKLGHFGDTAQFDAAAAKFKLLGLSTHDTTDGLEATAKAARLTGNSVEGAAASLSRIYNTGKITARSLQALGISMNEAEKSAIGQKQAADPLHAQAIAYHAVVEKLNAAQVDWNKSQSEGSNAIGDLKQSMEDLAAGGFGQALAHDFALISNGIGEVVDWVDHLSPASQSALATLFLLGSGFLAVGGTIIAAHKFMSAFSDGAKAARGVVDVLTGATKAKAAADDVAARSAQKNAGATDIQTAAQNKAAIATKTEQESLSVLTIQQETTSRSATLLATSEGEVSLAATEGMPKLRSLTDAEIQLTLETDATTAAADRAAIALKAEGDAAAAAAAKMQGASGGVGLLSKGLAGLSALVIPALLIPIGTMVIDAVNAHFGGGDGARNRGRSMAWLRGDTQTRDRLNAEEDYENAKAALDTEITHGKYDKTITDEQATEKQAALEKTFAERFRKIGYDPDTLEHEKKYSEMAAAKAVVAQTPVAADAPALTVPATTAGAAATGSSAETDSKIDALVDKAADPATPKAEKAAIKQQIRALRRAEKAEKHEEKDEKKAASDKAKEKRAEIAADREVELEHEKDLFDNQAHDLKHKAKMENAAEAHAVKEQIREMEEGGVKLKPGDKRKQKDQIKDLEDDQKYHSAVRTADAEKGAAALEANKALAEAQTAYDAAMDQAATLTGSEAKVKRTLAEGALQRAKERAAAINKRAQDDYDETTASLDKPEHHGQALFLSSARSRYGGRQALGDAAEQARRQRAGMGQDFGGDSSGAFTAGNRQRTLPNGAVEVQLEARPIVIQPSAMERSVRSNYAP